MAGKKDKSIGFKADEEFDQWLKDTALKMEMGKSLLGVYG